MLRIPSLFEPYWYGDEGIYLTLGMALRKGLVFYKDIHDNKPPLLYLIAALAGRQFWFRFILLWCNLLNVYLIFLLSTKIFKKELLALISCLFFVVFPLILESNIPNGEIFMIMSTTWAMLTLYDCLERKAKSASQRLVSLGLKKLKTYFFAGFLFSLAFLFKAPAVFSFLAALVFLFLFSKGQTLRNARSDLKQILNLLLGFIFLPGLTCIYYWLQGALPQYLTAAFMQNVGYLSSWGGEWNKPLISLSSGFTQRTLFLGIVLFVLYIFRKHFKKEFLLIVLWFFFDLFAALLSARPYPHYLIQTVPSLSILLIFALSNRKKWERVFGIFAFCTLFFSFFYYKFWRYPVGRYYGNFFEFATGQKSKEAYFSFFDSRVNQTYKLARIIKSFTDEWDYIFVWGNEPYLYALSNRLPPGRYTVAYHVIDFDGWGETIKAIKEKEPALIIIMEGEREFVQLENLLREEKYFKFNQIERANVFKKL